MGTLVKMLKNWCRTKFEPVVYENWGFRGGNKGFYSKGGGAKGPAEMYVITHVTSQCQSHEDHNPNYNNTIEYSIRRAPTIFKQGIHGIVIYIS